MLGELELDEEDGLEELELEETLDPEDWSDWLDLEELDPEDWLD